MYLIYIQLLAVIVTIKMKKVLILILVYSISLGYSFCQSKKYSKRINYLKSNPLYVTLFTLNQDSLDVMNSEDKAALSKLNERANKNLKLVFDTFWDLNDTIIYADFHQIKNLKKVHKTAVFIEPLSYGPNITLVKLNSPKKKSMFFDVIPQFLSGDSSTVEIATQIRSLKLQVTEGTFLNNKNLGSKIILTCESLAHGNQAQLDYINSIKSQFPNSFIEVGENVIINTILKKDPLYLYVYSLSTYNVEDGSMIRTR